MNSISSAATINVEKRGWATLWPFDITVSCAGTGAYSFSLSGWVSSSFFYPDATPISCVISETMTGEQSTYYISTVWDTWEDDDGIISWADSTLVDGHTLWVTNTLKSWGQPSSISSGSIVSSIPSDYTDTKNTSTAPSTRATVSLIAVQDPYTCGEWFVGEVSSEDISLTTVTIDLQQAGKSIKLFTPLLSSKWTYSQTIDYTNIFSSHYVQAWSYDVTVTATYKWTTDSMSYTTNITDQCDLNTSTPSPSYLDMLRERNADIIWAQKAAWAVKKPEAPKSLPKTGASL